MSQDGSIAAGLPMDAGAAGAMIGSFPLAAKRRRIDRRRLAFIALGIVLFLAIYLSPPWGDATDPVKGAVPLTREGKAALGLFGLTIVWWVAEVIPIGVTSIAIAVVQSLFLIRPAKEAFSDFMDPSVWFIFGSIIFGMVFTKTGITKRLAYKMLVLVGERTTMIYLGAFCLTAGLTLIMAHTAVAATVFPLLMAIYSLYDGDGRPTRFGKGLFIGMAFSAGAGSIITLLGAARGAVAIGFFKDIAGREISFLELTKFMAPMGVVMTLLTWVFIAVAYRPERAAMPGLRERARELYATLGPLSPTERLTLAIVGAIVVLLASQTLMPALAFLNKSAVILTGTLLFFLFRILDTDDLENMPWNIILLFGGAMSIGFCLWQTGAARWLALKWLVLFHTAPPFVFILALTVFVLIMTNFIMNVAAIAISLPVAIVMAQYLGVAPEVILFASLTAAGMPFLLLIGAAPNAIAYGSRQFSSRDFFLAGVPMTLLLLGVVALFVKFVWPWMGMPILTSPGP